MAKVECIWTVPRVFIAARLKSKWKTTPHFATLTVRGDGFENDRVLRSPVSSAYRCERSWVPLGRRRPVTTGALESKPFHEGEFDGFHSIPLRGYRCYVSAIHFALAIVSECRCIRNGASLLFHPRQCVPETFPPVACEQERELTLH